jgi:hypothetical protein
VAIAFSERMIELNASTVKLVGPGGRRVKARLQLTSAGRSARATAGADKVVLTPRTPLRRGKRYHVVLSRDLRDLGGNPLPPSALSWSFVTRR